MNFQHICRAKRKDTGDWCFGYYVRLEDSYKRKVSHRIYPGYSETDCGDFYPDWYEVDPATVCRCTGKYDRADLPIYEGDIVDAVDFREDDGYGLIEWDEEDARYIINGANGNDICSDFSHYYGTDVEVIGNRFDCPTLIGG